MVIAVIVFLPKKDAYDELKKTEQITAGTEEAAALIKEVADAVDRKDKRKMLSLMLSPDKVFMDELLEKMKGEKEMGQLKIVACTRLIRSHRNDNLSVHAYSSLRKKTYCFSLLKDKAGKYRLQDVSISFHKH